VPSSWEKGALRPFLEKTKNFPIIISPPRYLNNGTVARLMTHSGPLWRVGDSEAAAESSSLSPHVVTHLKMIRHTRTHAGTAAAAAAGCVAQTWSRRRTQTDCARLERVISTRSS
jgi:hypothetical protein